MNKLESFVRDTVYNAAIAKGATEISADHYAGVALLKYQRSDFKKIGKLIDENIKMAVKESKGKKKK